MADSTWTRVFERHVCNSKDDTLVEEVNLFDANTHYAHVRFSDGRETTVATKHFAPSFDDLPAHSSLDQHTAIKERDFPDNQKTVFTNHDCDISFSSPAKTLSKTMLIHLAKTFVRPCYAGRKNL